MGEISRGGFVTNMATLLSLVTKLFVEQHMLHMWSIKHKAHVFSWIYTHIFYCVCLDINPDKTVSFPLQKKHWEEEEEIFH